jgi:hypothetical protein
MFISQHLAHLCILQDYLHDIMTLHNGAAVPKRLSEPLCQQPTNMNHK